MLERLSWLMATRGVPEYIRSDNGPESTVKCVRRWLRDVQVKTLFIEPGRPWENGYVKGFSYVGTRNECARSRHAPRAVKPNGKATARGPCPPGRIFNLLLGPSGSPVSIAAFILRSYLDRKLRGELLDRNFFTVCGRPRCGLNGGGSLTTRCGPI